MQKLQQTHRPISICFLVHVPDVSDLLRIADTSCLVTSGSDTASIVALMMLRVDSTGSMSKSRNPMYVRACAVLCTELTSVV